MQQITAKYCFAASLFMFTIAAVAGVQLVWGLFSLPTLAGMIGLTVFGHIFFKMGKDEHGKPFPQYIVLICTFAAPLAYAFLFWVSPEIFGVLFVSMGAIGGALLLLSSLLLQIMRPIRS